MVFFSPLFFRIFFVSNKFTSSIQNPGGSDRWRTMGSAMWPVLLLLVAVSVFASNHTENFDLTTSKAFEGVIADRYSTKILEKTTTAETTTKDFGEAHDATETLKHFEKANNTKFGFAVENFEANFTITENSTYTSWVSPKDLPRLSNATLVNETQTGDSLDVNTLWFNFKLKYSLLGALMIILILSVMVMCLYPGESLSLSLQLSEI